jgi:hypothetical protein
MEVKIDTIVPTPSSLLLGGVIRGPHGAWLRFVTIEVEWSSMSWDVIQRIQEYSSRAARAEELTDPLF